MNKYESIIICKPLNNNKNTDYNLITEKVKEITKDYNLKVDIVGNKKLAYKIKDFDEGYYMDFDFKAEYGVVAPLEKYFKENDNILKFITIRVEE